MDDPIRQRMLQAHTVVERLALALEALRSGGAIKCLNCGTEVAPSTRLPAFWHLCPHILPDAKILIYGFRGLGGLGPKNALNPRTWALP